MKNTLFFILIAFLFIGCGDSDTKEEFSKVEIPLKTTAAVKATFFTSTTTVESGQLVDLQADEDIKIVAYQWWDEKGDLLSNSSVTQWKAPEIAGVYTITLTVIDIDNNYTHKSVDITVTGVEEELKPTLTPSNNTSFSSINTLLSQASQGTTSNVTYICIGDSTRAESKYKGEYLFYTLQDRLRTYNVTSHLLARAGHQAREFDTATRYPTWEDVVSRIPSDGESSIVDICLGINDFWDISASVIKPHIKSAIAKIKNAKPYTHFVLSMPNRVYNNESMTNELKRIYEELSNELGLPLNHIINGVMPTQSATSYSWYNDDGFNVHLSQSGQDLVARYILGNILP